MSGLPAPARTGTPPPEGRKSAPAAASRFAGADGHARAGADEIDARAGFDFAGLDEIVDGLGRGYDQIGLRAFPDLDRQHRSGLEAERDLVAARALEHGNELFQYFAHGGGRDDTDVSGAHGTSSRQQHGEADRKGR